MIQLFSVYCRMFMKLLSVFIDFLNQLFRKVPFSVFCGANHQKHLNFLFFTWNLYCCVIIFEIKNPSGITFWLQNQRIVKPFCCYVFNNRVWKGKYLLSVLWPYSNKWVNTFSFMERRFELKFLTFWRRDSLSFLKFKQWRK